MPRRSKKELFRSPHRLPLQTLPDVRRELSRLYRGGLNGRIPAGQMTKFAFLLDKIRGCLEAEAVVAATEAKAAKPEQLTTMNIISVPHAHYVKVVEGVELGNAPLTIEHQPEPEVFDRVQDIEPPVVEISPEIEPEAPIEIDDKEGYTVIRSSSLRRRHGL